MTHPQNPREPRILRTHRLITQGCTPQAADEFVKAAVEGLQTLASKAPAKRLYLEQGTATVRTNIQELLSQASHTAKSFVIKRAPLPAGKECA